MGEGILFSRGVIRVSSKVFEVFFASAMPAAFELRGWRALLTCYKNNRFILRNPLSASES
jgi:hypothetical protein